MSTRTLFCDGLFAGYAGVPVVRNLSIHVESGEVVAMLGPNGAGKTTTLLTLSGILPALGGTLEAIGQPVKGGQAHRLARRGVAHVPEDRALFFGLTTYENLRLGRRNRSDDMDLVLEYFPTLRLRLSIKAGALSGGEQQMLALGRALCGGPKLLMVDEMSLGLSPLIAQQLTGVLRQIAKQTNVGVLLVEQHIGLALEIADRVYVLNHGSLVLESSGAALRRDPTPIKSSYLGGQDHMTARPAEAEHQ